MLFHCARTLWAADSDGKPGCSADHGGGKRYTTLDLAHPDNPGEVRHGERDYGRFGSYFVCELTPTSPLKVRYRIWVQEGERTVEQCQAMYEAFANPPSATVGK